MGRKTSIRRLAKYLPLSIEFQTASALDGMADAGKDQHLDAIDGEFFVAQSDDDPENSFDQETGEITGSNHGDSQEKSPGTEEPKKQEPKNPTANNGNPEAAQAKQSAADKDEFSVE